MKQLSSALLLALLCMACNSPQSPQPVLPQRQVIIYPEKLDTLIHAADPEDEEPTEIKTLRDPTAFCQAFAARFGAGFVKDDASRKDGFPGTGRYRWKNQQGFGEKHLEVVLEIGLNGEYNALSLIFYNDQKLFCQNRPDIVQFVDSLARKTLYSLPAVKDPTQHRPTLYLPEDLGKPFFASCLREFHDMVNQRCPPRYGKLELSFEVDKQGRTTIVNEHELSAIQQQVLVNWLQNLQMPLVLYDTVKDTAEYRYSFEAQVEDSTELNRHLRRLRQDSLPGENEFSSARIIPAGKMGSEKPLMLVSTLSDNIYFFALSGKEAALVGRDSNCYTDGGIFFQDYDFDGVAEAVTQSGPNMNGNRTQQIFRWNKEAGRVEKAGSFFGDIQSDPKTHELRYSYSGSWYMDNMEARYGWYHHRLVPKWQVVSSLRERDMLPDNCCIVKRYTNPFFAEGKDTLVLTSKRFEVGR